MSESRGLWNGQSTQKCENPQNIKLDTIQVTVLDYGNTKVCKCENPQNMKLDTIQYTNEEESIKKLAAKNSETKNILPVLLVQIYLNAFNLIMDTYRVRAPNLHRP